MSSTTSSDTIGGIWAPCLTPVNKNLSVDHARLTEHVAWLLDSGCHGVTLFGTTGEASSFSANQRIKALEHIVGAGIDGDRLMIGNGFTASADTLSVTRRALDSGCRKVLMVPPFYFKDPVLDGLIDGYRHIFDELNSSELRVVLYNFPKLSMVKISHALIKGLLESHGDLIAGVKDSSGSWDSIVSYIRSFPTLAVFPGSDNFLLSALTIGGAGTITATATINSTGIRKIFELWHAGSDASQAAQTRAKKIRDTIFSYPSIAALKTVHAVAKGDRQWKRLCPPLVRLSKADEAGLMNTLAATDLDLNLLKH